MRKTFKDAMATREKWEDRFWGRVQKSASCWMWTGGVDRDGYGKFGPYSGQSLYAHRLAWSLSVGPVPAGLCVLHDCDGGLPVGDFSYRRCVNPAHLFLGTDRDNVADMLAKGRGRAKFGEQHGMAKLTAADVAVIRSEYVSGGVFQKEIAARFGVAPNTISRIVTGARWSK